MSTAIGKEAEEKAADYLKQSGFKILEQNWRTRFCEIDIVAKKEVRENFRKRVSVHFVEVKYRRNPLYGKGVEYITKTKLEQMRFASEMWVANHNWKGDYQIDVIALDKAGDSVEITYIANANI